MAFYLKLGKKKQKPIESYIPPDTDYPRYTYDVTYKNIEGLKTVMPIFAYDDNAANKQANKLVSIFNGKLIKVKRIAELKWSGGNSKWTQSQLDQMKKDQDKKNT